MPAATNWRGRHEGVSIILARVLMWEPLGSLSRGRETGRGAAVTGGQGRPPQGKRGREAQLMRAPFTHPSQRALPAWGIAVGGEGQ